MTEPTVTIYHNARCSNSRGALALIQAAGIEPRVIDYLKTPPDRATLEGLIRAAGLTPREVIRTKEAVYAELGLDGATDAALIDAMLAHPLLINRPFVVTPSGTRLCRPPEVVREILPA
ncbi:arsenate reductase (glutaredoxin) [Sphaerotilus microaerophilus]|jgi:arsenate reductase|uniref:Arsenate reductase n=1 Tax=Sphaerotilus microaerophilus TaxID=2914710 RepID=A0ABM7YT77_9BURK|nr:arsenate reductase (glutaredoxin) [Sphaerotilus sp. FB-5]BDI07816.1 arsenate reductase [Sphaerotilus sp. FB-5]